MTFDHQENPESHSSVPGKKACPRCHATPLSPPPLGHAPHKRPEYNKSSSEEEEERGGGGGGKEKGGGGGGVSESSSHTPSPVRVVAKPAVAAVSSSSEELEGVSPANDQCQLLGSLTCPASQGWRSKVKIHPQPQEGAECSGGPWGSKVNAGQSEHREEGFVWKTEEAVSLLLSLCLPLPLSSLSHPPSSSSLSVPSS